MTTDVAFALLLPAMLAAAVACGHVPAWSGTLPAPRNAPPDLALDCELASERCSRCHPIARVQLARVDSPRHWAWYVSRMRLQPRSGISDQDEVRIRRCLVARTFGLEALKELPP